MQHPNGMQSEIRLRKAHAQSYVYKKLNRNNLIWCTSGNLLPNVLTILIIYHMLGLEEEF